jgi:hypothetical protein
MELDREYILKEFLRIIWHMSDKEFQKRIWIEGLGPECIDFDETCDYFFHQGVDIIENYKNYGVSKDQYKVLSRFRKILDDFSEHHPEEPFEFIDTPEWQHVVDEAKKVLEAFNFKKT